MLEVKGVGVQEPYQGNDDGWQDAVVEREAEESGVLNVCYPRERQPRSSNSKGFSQTSPRRESYVQTLPCRRAFRGT
jgi:hypothetical protein